MATQSLLHRIGGELGITIILHSPRDTHLLFLTRFLRMSAYGSSTLILALYFSALGHSDAQIGLFMTLTLVGDVLISLLLTFVADSLGRRRILLLGALLMALSGFVFALTSNYWILLLAAVVGVISPSGNEIGPFRAIEESTLAHLAHAATRSDVFAWYVVVGTLGTAGGTFAAGWLVQSRRDAGSSDVAAYRLVFWIYAVLGLVKAGVTLLLSSQCEAAPETKAAAPAVSQRAPEQSGEEAQAFLGGGSSSSNAQRAPAAPAPKSRWAFTKLSPSSRFTLLKLCLLFSIDSLASGMVPMSLIAFYMAQKFSMPASTLGSIISVAAFMSSLGNIFASSISKRIGPIKTMVFTHLPSALLLAAVPAPRALAFTVAILVARATLASMDQAPRTAFLAAVVKPAERTAVMGVVNTVKTSSQSAGPLITGVLAGKGRFWIAFVVAGALKASYDLGLLAVFVNTKLDDGGEGDQRTEEPGIKLRDVGSSEEHRDEEEYDLASDSDESEHGRR